MFSDESTHPVDPKGRVFVPKRFHPGLPFNTEGARVVVLSEGLDGCLYLFTEEGHREAMAQVDTSTFANPGARALQRRLFRNTSRINLDASGRLLLPERYRELAGIGQEAVLVGVGARIEIWSPDRWQRFLESTPASLETLYDAGGVGLAAAHEGGGPAAG